jgi:hypothetical protein
MADRAKRPGETDVAELAQSATAPQQNESLVSQGMHAISGLFSSDAKKLDVPAPSPTPAAAFALLEEMKPQVLPFANLKNPAFVNFFHRFMSAWYAANEMMTNKVFTDANKVALRTAVHQMAVTFVEVQQLPAAQREGQDAEIARLGPQLMRLAAVY